MELLGYPGKKQRVMKVELYKKGQFWYRVQVWVFAADGRSPGVDPLARPVAGGSIGCVRGDAPMDGILGLLPGLALRAGVRHCGQGSGTTPRALPAITPSFPPGGAGFTRP